MPDAALQPSTSPITELKVTGHLMAMEEGLFCVYNTPGSAPPDAATGLPGVRITPAPGQTGSRVRVSGFNAEGWLGGEDGAALVRISGGPAQVLVTVYQDAAGTHDAPKLQVIRLSEDMAMAAAPEQVAVQEPVAEPPAAQPEAGHLVEVAAHIYGRGDVGGRLGEWMGEPGSKRWVEGFGLAPSGGVALADLEYQAVLGRGWLSPWAEGGQFCGSRGMSLPILGLRVRLRGEAASAYTAQVSATFVDGTQIGPVADGGAVEAPSLSPLEAFKVVLLPAGTAAGSQDAGRGKAEAVPAPKRKPGRKPAQAAAAPAEAPPLAAAKPASAKPASAKPGPGRGRGKAPAAPEPVPAAPAAKPPAKPKMKRTPATTRRR